jgi:hypothetical protein
MRRFLRTTLPVGLTLLTAAADLSAAAKPVPARLAQAQYVVLGYDLGDRFLSATEAIADADVVPEDRQALAGIQEQITKWNRYVIVRRPADAELFIAIRRGRRASSAAGGHTAPAARTSGRSLGLELSSADDMLSVYEAGGGTSAGGMSPRLLWRAQRPGGLSSGSPTLFEELRSAVESVAQQP